MLAVAASDSVSKDTVVRDGERTVLSLDGLDELIRAVQDPPLLTDISTSFASPSEIHSLALDQSLGTSLSPCRS